MRRVRSYILLLLVLTAALLPAEEPLAPDAESDFPATTNRERMVKVSDAQVAWANYARLRFLFPQIRHLNDHDIDHWVTNNFAYISEAQLQLNGIRQSEIPVNAKDRKVSMRPEGWQRAGFLAAEGGGMIDAKGNGISNKSVFAADLAKAYQALLAGNPGAIPKSVIEKLGKAPATIDALRVLGHSDGLMSLGEAVAETSRERALHYLLRERMPQGHVWETVQSLFVISLPFSILKDNGTSIPAAIYGRDSHVARLAKQGYPDAIYTDPFGYGQTAGDGRKIDMGGTIITDPLLRARFGQLPGETELGNAQRTHAWMEAHDAARNFQNGDRTAITGHLASMLEPIRDLIAKSSAAAQEKPYATPSAHSQPWSAPEFSLEAAMKRNDSQGDEHQAWAEHVLLAHVPRVSTPELERLLDRYSLPSEMRNTIALTLVARGKDPLNIALRLAKDQTTESHANAAKIIVRHLKQTPITAEVLAWLIDDKSFSELSDPRLNKQQRNAREGEGRDYHVAQIMRNIGLRELLSRNTPQARGMAYDAVTKKYISPWVLQRTLKSYPPGVDPDLKASLQLMAESVTFGEVLGAHSVDLLAQEKDAFSKALLAQLARYHRHSPAGHLAADKCNLAKLLPRT